MAEQQHPGFTISWSRVQAALARTHDLAPDEVSKLRARFGGMQRAGLLGAEARRGRGATLDYGPDQLHRVVLAFELVQLGIAPSVILRLVADFWDAKLRDIFDKAENPLVHGGPDVVLVLAGVTLGFGDEPVAINYITLDKLMQRLEFALDGKSLPARALVVNLTDRLRKFHRALVAVHLVPEAEVAAMIRSKMTRPSASRAAAKVEIAGPKGKPEPKPLSRRRSKVTA